MKRSIILLIVIFLMDMHCVSNTDIEIECRRIGFDAKGIAALKFIADPSFKIEAIDGDSIFCNFRIARTTLKQARTESKDLDFAFNVATDSTATLDVSATSPLYQYASFTFLECPRRMSFDFEWLRDADTFKLVNFRGYQKIEGGDVRVIQLETVEGCSITMFSRFYNQVILHVIADSSGFHGIYVNCPSIARVYLPAGFIAWLKCDLFYIDGAIIIDHDRKDSTSFYGAYHGGKEGQREIRIRARDTIVINSY